MVQNGAEIVVFQREPARPPGRNPSPPGGGDWLHWVRFRVLLGLTLIQELCLHAVMALATCQGGWDPPVLKHSSDTEKRIDRRSCTSARLCATWEGGCGHAARVNLGCRI